MDNQFAGFGAGPPPGFGMDGPPPPPRPHPLAGAFSPAALTLLQGAGVLPPHGGQQAPGQQPQQPNPAQVKQMKTLQDALAAFGRV